MQQLVPFDPKQTSSFKIEASAELKGGVLHLTYKVHDLKREVQGLVWESGGAPGERQDALWQSTCFESFVSMVARNYLELNISPIGNWNAYTFSDHRTPQPPTPEAGVKLVGFKRAVDGDTLTSIAQFSGNFQAEHLLSLCCVIKTKSQTLFFANVHAYKKPDFHQRDARVIAVKTV